MPFLPRGWKNSRCAGGKIQVGFNTARKPGTLEPSPVQTRQYLDSALTSWSRQLNLCIISLQISSPEDIIGIKRLRI